MRTERCLFTGKDIIAGQEIFLKNGLMEYGSIFGHGAWLGPDFTADYLHRAAELTIDYYGGNSLRTRRGSKPSPISKPTVTTVRRAC